MDQGQIGTVYIVNSNWTLHIIELRHTDQDGLGHLLNICVELVGRHGILFLRHCLYSNSVSI